MNRRHFLATGGAMLATSAFCSEAVVQRSGVSLDQEPLGYDFGALEPFIDGKTMELHYTQHHAACVRELHRVLQAEHLEAASVTSLLKTVEFLPPHGQRSVLKLEGSMSKLPEKVKLAIRTSGGGHMNHTLFWRYMAPPGSVSPEPRGKLADAINAAFGSLAAFKKAFTEAAMKRFGSGWAWLSFRADCGLFISTTGDQDSPVMKGVVPDAEHGRPILCLDLWEHAYYLKYQYRRADYIEAWWNVVNWPRVERSYHIVTTTPF